MRVRRNIALYITGSFFVSVAGNKGHTTPASAPYRAIWTEQDADIPAVIGRGGLITS